MREGTPSGFSTMSTGVPSGRNGMSQLGRMREMQPLFPWRPAILSPTERFFLSTRYTRTFLTTAPSSMRSPNPSSPCTAAASSISANRARNGETTASNLADSSSFSIW